MYKISKNKQVRYAYSDEELEKILEEIGRENSTLQRYKGLGEMDPKQLWETTMDPKKRSLVRVTMEDVVEADKIFSLLMGEQVEPRRRFIQEHAKEAMNIDI